MIFFFFVILQRFSCVNKCKVKAKVLTITKINDWTRVQNGLNGLHHILETEDNDAIKSPNTHNNVYSNVVKFLEFFKALYLVYSFFICMLMIYHPVWTVYTPVLFVDNTNIIITEPDVSCLAELSDHIFIVMNKWFTGNKLPKK